MIHALAEIAAADVVVVVAEKVEQILLKHQMRIQQHHHLKILKNLQRIAAADVVAQLVKALFLVRPLKKMA
jgi:pSer/pThr/pTyr-binding forkhead associated (FHA) protein